MQQNRSDVQCLPFDFHETSPTSPPHQSSCILPLNAAAILGLLPQFPVKLTLSSNGICHSNVHPPFCLRFSLRFPREMPSIALSSHASLFLEKSSELTQSLPRLLRRAPSLISARTSNRRHRAKDLEKGVRNWLVEAAAASATEQPADKRLEAAAPRTSQLLFFSCINASLEPPNPRGQALFVGARSRRFNRFEISGWTPRVTPAEWNKGGDCCTVREEPGAETSKLTCPIEVSPPRMRGSSRSTSRRTRP